MQEDNRAEVEAFIFKLFNSTTTAKKICQKLLEHVQLEAQGYPSIQDLSNGDMSFWVDHVGLPILQAASLVNAFLPKEEMKVVVNGGASAGSTTPFGTSFKTPEAGLQAFSLPSSTQTACVTYLCMKLIDGFIHPYSMNQGTFSCAGHGLRSLTFTVLR